MEKKGCFYGKKNLEIKRKSNIIIYMSVLELIDEDSKILKELGDDFSLNDGVYKFKKDDVYYNVIKRKHELKHWHFITISLNDVLQGRKKNIKFGYILIVDDGIYYWNYNELEICLAYDLSQENRNFKNAHVLLKHFKKLI